MVTNCAPGLSEDLELSLVNYKEVGGRSVL